MKYFLVKRSKNCKVEITAESFAEIIHLQKVFPSFLDTEERLNLVLDNYLEYEEELSKCILEYAIFSFQTWAQFTQKTYTVSRRILNLLASCRFYIDHYKQECNKIFAEDPVKKKQFSDQFAEEYDRNFGYRVCEALRNYTQHKNIPIQTIGYAGSLVEDNFERVLKYSVHPRLSIKKLQEDKKFKRQVLDEFEPSQNEIDIKPFIRQYMEALVDIQAFLRKSISPTLSQWENKVTQLEEQFRGHFPEKFSGIELWEIDESGKVLQEVDLLSEYFQRIKWLIEKNQSLRMLSSFVFST
jgi:hypothetical protein